VRPTSEPPAASADHRPERAACDAAGTTVDPGRPALHVRLRSCKEFPRSALMRHSRSVTTAAVRSHCDGKSGKANARALRCGTDATPGCTGVPARCAGPNRQAASFSTCACLWYRNSSTASREAR
jgi:hypothetical protein